MSSLPTDQRLFFFKVPGPILFSSSHFHQKVSPKIVPRHPSTILHIHFYMSGARFALVLGDRDLENGTVGLKDLVSGKKQALGGLDVVHIS